MDRLRLLLIAMIVLAVFVTVRTAIWEAHCTDGNRTWIIKLPETAIWDPPPVPEYSDSAGTFNDLPETQPPNFQIFRHLKWDWMLLELPFYCLGSFLLIAPLYWLTCSARPDPVIHVTTWIGIGMAGSAVVCFSLWLAFGGWGPPAQLFFGIIGLCAGAIAGFATLPKTESNDRRQRWSQGEIVGT